jgi:hypothetical protein
MSATMTVVAVNLLGALFFSSKLLLEWKLWACRVVIWDHETGT